MLFKEHALTSYAERPAGRMGVGLTACCITWLLFSIAQSASAAVLCVDPAGKTGCQKTIGAAVAAANPGDIINVAPGTYAETVTIGKVLTLNGASAATTIIDASGLSWGIYVDGIDNPNLAGVVISGLTIQNAKFEGILVTNASYVTLADNIVTGNNTGLVTDANGKLSCPGLPAFETNEAQDCGEGIHLEGADHSRVLNNVVRNNAGGILITDDTGATFENVIAGNKVIDNVSDCGITLASHVAATMTNSAVPLGVYHNTVSGNVSSGNGTKTGEGAGVGIFASAPKTANYGNVVINNQLTGNGIPGVAIHGHAPGQNLNDNVIVGNQISGNGPDAGDPAPTGIHVSSVVPVLGLVISDNTISGETVSIAIAAGGEMRVQRNSLGGRLGIDNMGAGRRLRRLQLVGVHWQSHLSRLRTVRRVLSCSRQRQREQLAAGSPGSVTLGKSGTGTQPAGSPGVRAGDGGAAGNANDAENPGGRGGRAG